MDRPKRVIVYTSPENAALQIRECKKYCRQNRWPAPKTENIFAGRPKDADRSALWAAVESVQRKDVLLVVQLARLDADVYASHFIEQRLRKAGGRLVSTHAEGDWTDSPADRMIRETLRSYDAFRQELSARLTQLAMIRSQQDGKRVSKVPPYGWQADPDDSARLIPDEEEQAGIKRCMELLNEGHSLRSAADVLDREGYPSRLGEWSYSQVRRIQRRVQAAIARPDED